MGRYPHTSGHIGSLRYTPHTYVIHKRAESCVLDSDRRLEDERGTGV